MKKRRDQIEEYLRKDRNYKANLPLVMYQGCVLTEDMVMSGTLEVRSEIDQCNNGAILVIRKIAYLCIKCYIDISQF